MYHKALGFVYSTHIMNNETREVFLLYFGATQSKVGRLFVLVTKDSQRWISFLIYEK